MKEGVESHFIKWKMDMVKFENAFRLLTSFDPKNVTSRTGVSNWPPLIQKHDRHQQEDPTDHLWSKNVTVTHRGVQLTCFDPKTLPLLTGGSNWPFRCLDAQSCFYALLKKITFFWFWHLNPRSWAFILLRVLGVCPLACRPGVPIEVTRASGTWRLISGFWA